MAETKTFKVPANRVGYASKSKAGNTVITVEQDITLKKGQKIILNKKSDIMAKAEANGKQLNFPEWLTHQVDVLPDKDK